MAVARTDVRKSSGTDMDPASRIQRRVHIQDAQLPAAKVSNPRFRGKARNSPDISKGISRSGMCKFESSEVSQAFRRSARLPRKGENGPGMPAFARSASSPGSRIGNRRTPIGESLRPHPRLFPFCRDCRQRPGSITIPARWWQSNSPLALAQEGQCRVPALSPEAGSRSRIVGRPQAQWSFLMCRP
jgi:hypothetical protein